MGRTIVNNPLPFEAFGPPSWISIGGLLRPIYRSVKWHKDEPIDPNDPPPPLNWDLLEPDEDLELEEIEALEAFEISES